MSVDEGQLVMSDVQGKLTVSKIKGSCLCAESVIGSPKGTFSINYNAYLNGIMHQNKKIKQIIYELIYSFETLH